MNIIGSNSYVSPYSLNRRLPMVGRIPAKNPVYCNEFRTRNWTLKVWRKLEAERCGPFGPALYVCILTLQ